MLAESMNDNSGRCYPHYQRTRIVIAKEVQVQGNTQLCFTCTCRSFKHYLVMCRHVYAVIKREPTPGDVFPECRKEYETLYLCDERYSAWVDERTASLEFNSGEHHSCVLFFDIFWITYANLNTYFLCMEQGFCFIGTLLLSEYSIAMNSHPKNEYDASFWETIDGNNKSCALLNNITQGADFTFGTLSQFVSPSSKRFQPVSNKTNNSFSKTNNSFSSFKKKLEIIYSRAHTEEQMQYLEQSLSEINTNITFLGQKRNRCCSDDNPKEGIKKLCGDNGEEFIKDNTNSELGKHVSSSLHSVTPVCKAWKLRRPKGIGSPRR